MYFYEIHEGDGDLFHDMILIHDTEFDPESFFDMVQEIRERVVDGFEQDTLVEAIAEELEREHGFEAAWDHRLTAAVNVARSADDTFLAEVDDDDEIDDDGNLRTVIAELRANDVD